MKILSLLACVLALAAGAAQAQQRVKAPPLPAGSDKVRVAPGLNPDEAKRSVRAHHHKGHVKKDVTRDDTLPGNSGNGNNNAGGKK
jgi:hypothetical protein